MPVRVHSRFGIASVTKMITAVAALKLVDEGLMALEQPLIEVLPASQHIAALGSDHNLHHVLSHTSALPSSDLGVATVVTYYPDIRLTVVVLCNQDRVAYAAEAQVGSTFGAPRRTLNPMTETGNQPTATLVDDPGT